MRSYPIDADRTDFRSTGGVAPVPQWVEVDGARRPDPNGRQGLNAEGVPLWTVEVVSPADATDPRDKAEVFAVEIASHVRPDAGTFGARLLFTHLTVSTTYVRKADGKQSVARWTASGVRIDAPAQRRPEAA